MKISEQVNTSCSFLRRPLDSTGKRCNIKKSLPEDNSWRCQQIEQNLKLTENTGTRQNSSFCYVHPITVPTYRRKHGCPDIFLSAGCQ